jgi:hypothetical protein
MSSVFVHSTSPQTIEVRVVSESGVTHHAVFAGCTHEDAAAWGFAAAQDDLIAAPGVIVSMTGGVALV